MSNSQEESPFAVNQKKNKAIVGRKKGGKQNIYLAESLKKIIQQQKGSNSVYYCDLCPDKPTFVEGNINRHLLYNETYASIRTLQEHIDGYDEFLH